MSELPAWVIVVQAVIFGGIVSVAALGASVYWKLGMIQRETWPDGKGSGVAVALDAVMVLGGPAVAILSGWMMLRGR
jgi:hypothetical protein